MFSRHDLPECFFVAVPARRAFGDAYRVPAAGKERVYVLPVEEASRVVVYEVVVRFDLFFPRGGVVGVFRGVEASQEVSAGDEATPDVLQDLLGLLPGKVVEGEAGDYRAER